MNFSRKKSASEEQNMSDLLIKVAHLEEQVDDLISEKNELQIALQQAYEEVSDAKAGIDQRELANLRSQNVLLKKDIEDLETFLASGASPQPNIVDVGIPLMKIHRSC